MKNVKYSVFTKPWKNLSMDELGKKISGMGFDGIEFPLRDEFQVEPSNAEKGLLVLKNKLAEYGVDIYSVASSTEENVFAGCQNASIPIIRIMGRIEGESYMAEETRILKELESLIPLCEKYKVKIGIQNHCGKFINNSMGLRHILEKLDSEWICAVWDAAHNALNGEDTAFGIDIVKEYLCMVNLKNAYWQRVNGPEAEYARWKHYFTDGRNGFAVWPDVIEILNSINFDKVICLTAEYTNGDVDRLIVKDFNYVKEIVAKVLSGGQKND